MARFSDWQVRLAETKKYWQDIIWTLRWGNRQALEWPNYLRLLPLIFIVGYEGSLSWVVWRFVHNGQSLSVSAGILCALLCYYPILLTQVFRRR